MENKSLPTAPVLSELDRMLVEELKDDARQSTRDLGAKLGVSATTVSSRLRKMVTDGIIGFATMVDPRFLGYTYKVILGVKTNPGIPMDTAKHLADYKNIQTISLTTGRYDMVIYALFRDVHDLFGWVANELSRFDDISTVEIMPILHELKDYYSKLSDTSITFHPVPTPRCLDEAELKLIRELELSPRESIGILGKKTGMTRQTTARKLKRLLEEKVISVVSHADLSAVGLSMPVFLFLKVKADMMLPAARSLAADTRVTHVAAITGSSNLLVYMAFPNTEKMYHFLTRDLRAIPGVIDYETMMQAGRSYRSFGLTTE